MSISRNEKNYRLYLSSNFLSTLGDAIGTISLSWWAINETKSATSMALIMTPSIVASIFGAPFCGVLADSISRKKMIIISEIILSFLWLGPLIMFSIGYFNLTFLSLYFFIVSLAQVQLKAAASGILPDLVGSKSIQGPMAKIQAMNTTARIIGAMSSAFFLQFFGMKAAFIFNIITFLISVLLMLQIDIKEDLQETINIKVSDLKVEMIEGIKYFKKFPLLAQATLYMIMAQFFISALPTLLPSYVKLVRDLPAWYFGVLEGSLGLGAIVGTLFIMPLSRKFFSKRSLEVGIGFTIIGAILFTFDNNLILPVLAVLLIQSGFISIFIPISSRVIADLPANHRSRVYSIINSFIDVSALIGLVTISAAYSNFGHDVVFYSMAIFYLILFGFIVYKDVSVRLSEVGQGFMKVKSPI